jgi:hypothetical protein
MSAPTPDLPGPVDLIETTNPGVDPPADWQPDSPDPTSPDGA